MDDIRLRVIQVADLLHDKTRAARESSRRRSKRLRGLADAEALIETNPELAQKLASEERGILDRLPRSMLHSWEGLASLMAA